MATEISLTPAQVLEPFSLTTSITDNDFILFQANQNAGGTGVQVAARIPVPLFRRYIVAALDLSDAIGDALVAAQVITAVAQELTAQQQQQARANIGAAAKVTKVTHTQYEDNVSIAPEVLHEWAEVPASGLTVSFTGASGGDVVDEYKLRLTVASDGFELTLPEGVTWANDEAPDFENGYTYEISIIDNLAVYAGWETLS